MQYNLHGLIDGCLICTKLDPQSSSSSKLSGMCYRWGILPKHKEPDTAIINVYDVEDCIPPHIDHHDFDRPFCTISLLSEQHIMFGSKIISRGPGDFVCDYEMPLPTGMHCSWTSRYGVHDTACRCKHWKCLTSELLQSGQCHCFIWTKLLATIADHTICTGSSDVGNWKTCTAPSYCKFAAHESQVQGGVQWSVSFFVSGS
jgi:hypothetical protein